MSEVPLPMAWRLLPPVPEGLLEQAAGRFYGGGTTVDADQAEGVWALAQALLGSVGTDRVVADASPGFMQALDKAAKMAGVCAGVRRTGAGLVLSVRRPIPMEKSS